MTPIRATDAARAALRADDRLDDLTRARVWGQLERALDTPAPVVVVTSRWRRVVLAAALVAAVALAGALVTLVARPGAHRAGGEALDLPDGASARVQLGAAAAITLHGPARFQVDRIDRGDRGDRVVEVRLDRGELVGAYDHAAGGRLRIRTPHAVVDIVGTAFAIEVGRATCVSVAHGLVEVAAAGGETRRLGGKESWCTDADELRAMPGKIESEIADHERGTIAARAPSPNPDPTPIPTPNPIPTPYPNPNPIRTRSPVRPDPGHAIVRTSPPIDPPPAATVADDPPPPAPPPPAPAPTDADLYRAAERALRNGDPALADAQLARLLVDHPDSPLADDAQFERARLAYQRGAWPAALASLDAILDSRSPLRTAARSLACRIAARTHTPDPRRCPEATP